MSYLDKICKNCKDNLVTLPCMPSLTIPHQSFTPREILAQFVRNDVQVQRLQPTDEVDTLEAMSFEDDFEARQFVRNELPDIVEQRKQQDQEQQQQQPSRSAPDQEQRPSRSAPDQEQQPSGSAADPEQKPEQQPVKVEVVKPEQPYTTGYRSYL